MTGAAPDVAARLAALHARIGRAAARAGRSPDEITLVGISKLKSAAMVVEAVAAGLRYVGENYVQESVVKIPEIKEELAKRGLAVPRWHFIGRLQRNKARHVVEHFDVVETVDRLRLAEELDRRAGQAGRVLDVLLQVNVSGEAQKGGVDPDALPELLAASAGWRHLRTVGLMAIPAPAADAEATRPAFAHLRTLRAALADSAAGAASGGRAAGAALRELSMGMSADFEVAIEEGATIIRVGTAVFGARDT
jgi:pyridoxal phosphate enzyme (YggS family)